MEIGRERYAFMNAIKCGARTRQDSPCKAPAIKGKRRCRICMEEKGVVLLKAARMR